LKARRLVVLFLAVILLAATVAGCTGAAVTTTVSPPAVTATGPFGLPDRAGLPDGWVDASYQPPAKDNPGGFRLERVLWGPLSVHVLVPRGSVPVSASNPPSTVTMSPFPGGTLPAPAPRMTDAGSSP